MVYRKKKYAKKSYGRFRKRRYSKSKYGRFRRGIRKVFRKYARNTMVVPRNKIAVDKCFIKIRAQERFELTNAASKTLVNIQVVGNGLDGIWTPDSGLTLETRVDKKLIYYGRLYNRYYAYASKVTCRFFQGYINEANAVPQIPIFLYIIPQTGQALPIIEDNLGFRNDINQARPDMWPQSKIRYIEGIRFGKGPAIMKHKMTTKKMFQKNTKTDDDYCGSLNVNESLGEVSVTNPAGGDVWNWNIGGGLIKYDDNDTVPADALNMWCLITIDYYIMLYNKNTFADTVETT